MSKEKFDNEPQDATMNEGIHDTEAEGSTERDHDATEAVAPKKKKRKANPHHLLHQSTLRKPSWTYFHLALFSPYYSQRSMDILTTKSHLNSALRRFLGLHGEAITVDILRVDKNEVWIRVPREDATAVHEALSSWTGDGVRFVVKGRDAWLIRLAGGGDGQDLFKP